VSLVEIEPRLQQRARWIGRSAGRCWIKAAVPHML